MLSYEARYQGAWGEISSRIQSRQNVATVYMTGAITMLGFSVVAPNPPSAQWTWRLGFVVLLPLLSFAVAKWLRNNDAVIGVLGRYCSAVEEACAVGTTPAWHSEKQGFMDLALFYRSWSDQAAIIVCSLSCLPVMMHLAVGAGFALGDYWPLIQLKDPPLHLGRLDVWDALFCLISAAYGVSAICILLGNAPLRSRILHEFDVGSDGHLGRRQVVSGPAMRNGIVRFLEAFWIPGSIPNLKQIPDRSPPAANTVSPADVAAPKVPPPPSGSGGSVT